MDDLALEEIRDRRKPDVRMRAHIDAATGRKSGRPHVIEEDEGADQLARRRGQHAADGEAAEVARAGGDHGCEPRSPGARRRGGFDVGEYAHAGIVRRDAGENYGQCAPVKPAD